MIEAMRKSVHTASYTVLREELRQMREGAGLSQRELASKLRVAHSVVAKIETGERRIDAVELCQFASACGGDPLAIMSKVARHVRNSATRTTRGGRH